MICTPTSLIAAAAYLGGLPEELLRRAWAYLLCQWANKAGGGHQAETLAYQANIITAGGTISEASLNCVDTFVLSCKAANIWTKLWDVGLFMGDQLAAALVKLKDYSGVTPSLLNTNFLSADYSEAAGLVGDGATKYLDTGVVTDPMNNLSVYLRTLVVLSTGYAIGESVAGGNVPGIAMKIRSAPAAGFKGFFGGANTTPNASLYAPDSVGLLSQVFRTTTNMSLYLNGGVATNNSSTIGNRSTNNQTAWIFAANNIGTPTGFCNFTMSFYCMGDSLSDADSLALYNAVQALQTCLSRQV